jgi:hypothetical protein
MQSSLALLSGLAVFLIAVGSSDSQILIQKADREVRLHVYIRSLCSPPDAIKIAARDFVLVCAVQCSQKFCSGKEYIGSEELRSEASIGCGGLPPF